METLQNVLYKYICFLRFLNILKECVSQRIESQGSRLAQAQEHPWHPKFS